MEEELKRDSGVYVLLYRREQGGPVEVAERETKKEVTDLIAELGGEDVVVKLYAGAKERAIRRVVSYTF